MLCAGLASCEMKEEILGDKGFSGDSGYLNMGVVVDEAVNAISTKAGETDDEEIVVEGTPANGFIVELTGPDNYTKTFTYQSGMEPVELPVGDFTVYAHTDGSLDDTTAPFYGKTDNFKISKGAETKVGIQCEMMNTMFQLKYDAGFITMYRKWEITVTAGKHSKPYIFEKTDVNSTPQNPDPIYWYLGDEEVKNFIVDVRAWTQEGNIPVTATQSFSKDDLTAYTGGEAVSINMKPGSPDVSTDGTAAIDIEVTLFSPYEDIDESIEIDGTPTEEPEEPVGPQEPDEPAAGDAPTMTMPNNGEITYTLGGNDKPASADVLIKAPKGIKSLNVKIESGNEKFGETIDAMSEYGLDFVTAGVEMVGNGTISGVLSAFGGGDVAVSVPSVDGTDTEYSFPVGAFFGLMDGFGATAPKAHVFKIVLEDGAGNIIDEELSVTINPAN